MPFFRQYLLSSLGEVHPSLSQNDGGGRAISGYCSAWKQQQMKRLPFTLKALQQTALKNQWMLALCGASKLPSKGHQLTVFLDNELGCVLRLKLEGTRRVNKTAAWLNQCTVNKCSHMLTVTAIF